MDEKYSRSDVKHKNKIKSFFANAPTSYPFEYIRFIQVTKFTKNFLFDPKVIFLLEISSWSVNLIKIRFSKNKFQKYGFF